MGDSDRVVIRRFGRVEEWKVEDWRKRWQPSTFQTSNHVTEFSRQNHKVLFFMDILSHNPSSTEAASFNWPSGPSAILIMGKRQGTKKENKQLWGRAAMAAALWYSAPNPKPYLIFVASDVHGPKLTPDASVVKSMLVDRFHVPADFVITRQQTNCTLLEVRAARVLRRAYGLAHVFALTHLYHAARAQRYLNEILPDASVIPVHLDILDEIQFPMEATVLWLEIRALIKDSQPGRLDTLREYIVEWLLNQAHTFDPRGRYERRLARLLRPGAYTGEDRSD